jgi:sulfur transfer protein SufE
LTTQDILDAFALLDEWDARYEVIGEFAREVPVST